MLKSISVKNFKSLRSATLQFRPITLLVGPNNSGKSSLISLLLTLKQTLESRNLESPFVLDGAYVQLGSFQDVIFGHMPKRKIQIDMKFAGSKIERKRRDRGFLGAAPFSISIKVCLSSDTKTIQLTDLRIFDSQSETTIEVKSRRIISLFGKKANILIRPRGSRASDEPYVTQRHFLWQVSLPRVSDRASMMKEFFLRRIGNYLEQYFQENIVYLGPLREYPKRYYISSGEKPSDVGLRGERTVDFLYLDSMGITSQINQWLRKFKIAEQITVAPVGRAEGVWKVELLNAVTQSSDNLKDVGFGVSQILPIVVEGIMAKPGTTMIVEQPEIHLHPKAQAQLADLFIDLAKQEKFSIIETHSEHMLLRLARRIAEGKLRKRDIAIYEFKLTRSGTLVREIPFDNQGNLRRWPGEFFEAELEETLKHVEARSALARKEMK
jgi:predicted ATPase